MNKSVLSSLIDILMQRGDKLALAESCTGGLVAAILTQIAGSSAWFEGGVVSYSNELKTKFLNVSPECLAEYGAVSEQTAEQMVRGVCANCGVQVGASITGIAGPGGGSDDKPVGTVCFGWSVDNQVKTVTKHFEGDRQQVQNQARDYVLAGLVEMLQN